MLTGTVFKSPRLLVAWMVAAVFVLNGCALTLGYRHADWIIRWQLDHYLDLTSNQRREVTARLQPLLLRHRMEALPQYEQFLKEVKQRISRGLSREDLDWTYSSYERFRADLFERVVPEGAVLLTTVSEKQVGYLGKVFRKEEAKAERGLQRPAGERFTERTRRVLAFAEEWLGPLSAEQSARIRTLSLALPDTQPVWWQYRRQRHEEILALLRHPVPAEDLSRSLRGMFVHPEETAPPSYLEMVRDARAALTLLVLEIDRLLTPIQRRHVMTSIQTLIDELHTLGHSS